jgi:hypothetical protein
MKSGVSLEASAPSFSSAVAISFSVIGQVLGQKVYRVNQQPFAAKCLVGHRRAVGCYERLRNEVLQ